MNRDHMRISCVYFFILFIFMVMLFALFFEAYWIRWWGLIKFEIWRNKILRFFKGDI